MKRLLAALLGLCLLSGCAGELTLQPEPSLSSGSIAYVPLDDRPDNAERVKYLANSLGYRLMMPDEDLYQTKLDGQPCNENGTQSGDRAALYDWVMAQEESGCDRYILSLDQLLSGGLVASRQPAGAVNPVSMADGGYQVSENQLVTQLITTLAADPSNQVWLLDTVMRLAPTYGYGGFTLNEYNALRAYGMAARPELTGDDLTVDNIVLDYALGTDGNLIAATSDEPLPEDAVKNYLTARERKLRLSAETQRLLSGDRYDSFHLLIGIDDSSAEDSIQKNEIAFLRSGLRMGADGNAMDWLLSGVDDLAFKAVAKLYLSECDWQGATADVAYYGGTEDQPACAYDYQPLMEIISEHLDFFGLTAGSDQHHDLQILVLTQPADPVKGASYYGALIDQLNENEENRIPTILIDAANNTYGTAFHDALVKQTNLGYLLSYSGFLDMAIVTGTALSHGVARFAWLANGGGAGVDDLANLAFQQGLVESVALDFCYRNTVREDLSAYVRSLGGDPNNFCTPAMDTEELTLQLNSRMGKATGAVLKNFSRSNLLVTLDASAEHDGLAGWGKVTLSNWSYPWNRVFEVRMEIQPAPLAKIHKKFLFFTF